jgi:hypothetical protein
MIPGVMRAIFSKRNIRRAPGQSGQLNRFRHEIYGTESWLYISANGTISPLPASLVVQVRHPSWSSSTQQANRVRLSMIFDCRLSRDGFGKLFKLLLRTCSPNLLLCSFMVIECTFISFPNSDFTANLPFPAKIV